jgi:hypothetical protein
LFRLNDEALIDELGRAREKPICSKSFTSTIRRRGFFRSFAEAADFSDILLNFRIFVAQISLRQTCPCHNLDAELIDFVKRYEKLQSADIGHQAYLYSHTA